MRNINDLKINNTAFVFLDHQSYVAFPVRSISPDELTNNVTALAKVGQSLNIPVVLSTINAQGDPLTDPLFKQLEELFPHFEPIDRSNTNAWAEPAFVRAVEETNRRKIVICGLWSEVALAQTVLSMLGAGYEVYFVSDASGGLSRESHEDAKALMIQAGAKPITWFAVLASLCPDSTSPEYAKMYDFVAHHGAGVSYAVQSVLANMNQLPASSVAYEAH